MHRGPARQVAGCLAVPLSQLNQRFFEKSSVPDIG